MVIETEHIQTYNTLNVGSREQVLQPSGLKNIAFAHLNIHSLKK
jgi:hypothetical protein